MPIIVDDDLRTVAEYMQANVAAAKLVPLAEALNAVAPLLWGRYGRDDLVALSLGRAASEPKAATGLGQT